MPVFGADIVRELIQLTTQSLDGRPGETPPERPLSMQGERRRFNKPVQLAVRVATEDLPGRPEPALGQEAQGSEGVAVLLVLVPVVLFFGLGVESGSVESSMSSTGFRS